MFRTDPSCPAKCGRPPVRTQIFLRLVDLELLSDFFSEVRSRHVFRFVSSSVSSHRQQSAKQAQLCQLCLKHIFIANSPRSGSLHLTSSRCRLIKCSLPQTSLYLSHVTKPKLQGAGFEFPSVHPSHWQSKMLKTCRSHCNFLSAFCHIIHLERG